MPPAAARCACKAISIARWRISMSPSGLRRKGDLARAIADYSEALRIAPRMLGAHVARGIALEITGDRAGARADYEAVLAAQARGEGGERAQATARARLAMLTDAERSA